MVSSTSDFCSQDFFRDAVVVVVFILSILSLFLFSIVYAGSIHESFMTDSHAVSKKELCLFLDCNQVVLASSVSACFRPYTETPPHQGT